MRLKLIWNSERKNETVQNMDIIALTIHVRFKSGVK